MIFHIKGRALIKDNTPAERIGVLDPKNLRVMFGAKGGERTRMKEMT